MGKYYGLWVMWKRDKTIFLPPSLPRIGLRMDFENQDFVLILHKHKWEVLSKEVTSMEIFTFFQWFQLPTILLFIGSLVTQLSLLVFIQCCGALALNKLKFLILMTSRITLRYYTLLELTLFFVLNVSDDIGEAFVWFHII